MLFSKSKLLVLVVPCLLSTAHANFWTVTCNPDNGIGDCAAFTLAACCDSGVCYLGNKFTNEGCNTVTNNKRKAKKEAKCAVCPLVAKAVIEDKTRFGATCEDSVEKACNEAYERFSTEWRACRDIKSKTCNKWWINTHIVDPYKTADDLCNEFCTANSRRRITEPSPWSNLAAARQASDECSMCINEYTVTNGGCSALRNLDEDKARETFNALSDHCAVVFHDYESPCRAELVDTCLEEVYASELVAPERR